MLKCVTKVITGVLAVSCLSVAALNVRLMMSTSSSVKLEIPSINLAAKIATKNTSLVQKFETQLAEISFPQTDGEKVAVKKVMPKMEKIAAQVETPIKGLINFDEPVKLEKVKIDYSLPQNLVALMPSFESFTSPVMVAEVKEAKSEVMEDKISTTLAAGEINADEEPVFFEYSTNEDNKTIAKSAPTKEEVITKKPVYTKADYEQMAEEFIAFGYSSATEESAGAVADQSLQHVQVIKENSKVQVKNPGQNKVAQSKPVTTQQKKSAAVGKMMNPLTTQKENALPAIMSIQAVATNFKRVNNVKNFEVRFQDDLNDIHEDFGAGEVQLAVRINESMTRSLVLLKRGYAPTNTDLIIENNSKVTLPLIEERVLNELLDGVERSAAVGALLIEFDEETEVALLDSEYSHEIMLDKNLKKTNSEDFSYKLFVGVPAGNVFLKYKKFDGTEAAKIVHIHEREVSFDANIYEDVTTLQVALYEEGLLAKELSPLITAGEQVRVFATDVTARKLNQNTYKLHKKNALLGERHYLEVNHLEEPIFVGYRGNKKIILPSENFINFVLSKFEDRKLGNRCIIQVNIDAPVASFYVGTESAGNNLVTSSQVLDQDGKFYDSVGPKSSKIIILGENFAQPEQNQDGKVNIKIDYLDGTSRYLSSYCSPNTYLVEQL